MTHSAWVLALCASATLVCGTSGCASPDCSDTATCAPSDDGGPGGDSDASPGSDAACDPADNACADPQCRSSFVCLPFAPEGWVGPIALFDQGGGPPVPTAPSCAGPYGDDLFDGLADLSSSPLDCTCGCGAPQGQCTIPSLGVYADLNCQNLCSTIALPSACASGEGAGCNTGGGSANVSELPLPLGTWSCTPQTSAPPSPYGWGRVGRGCGVTRAFAAGGCASNEVCAEVPPAGFQAALCLYMAADTDCTALPGYPVLHKYYASAQDTRSCGLGSCACDAPPHPSCQLQGTAAWFNSGSPDCEDGGLSIPPTGACSRAVTGSQVVWIDGEMTVSLTGTCPSSGSAAPQGSVTPDPATAVTVCCAQ